MNRGPRLGLRELRRGRAGPRRAPAAGDPPAAQRSTGAPRTVPPMRRLIALVLRYVPSASTRSSGNTPGAPGLRASGRLGRGGLRPELRPPGTVAARGRRWSDRERTVARRAGCGVPHARGARRRAPRRPRVGGAGGGVRTPPRGRGLHACRAPPAAAGEGRSAAGHLPDVRTPGDDERPDPLGDRPRVRRPS